ncbi:MAG: hypothetical protein M0D55_15975 [Elusimicrobiota bacterium]|nr:MAG: hypothetical protein M0D55_15975 [Elusimicrobiota bacterium]
MNRNMDSATSRKRTIIVYVVSVLAFVIAWAPLALIHGGKPMGALIDGILQFGSYLLGGGWHWNTGVTKASWMDVLIAVLFNPMFLSGFVIGISIVDNWIATLKGLIPICVGSFIVFLVFLGLSFSDRSSGNDMKGFWIVVPMATLLLWPFAWFGAIAGWKLGRLRNNLTGRGGP